MSSDWNVPFRALIDAAPDGLVVCEPSGRLVLVSAEAERMFGYDRDELPGQSIDGLIPEHVRPRHHHHLASYAAAPRPRPMGSNLDLRGRRKDGTEFPVEISLSPFTTERGLLIIAGVRDVTERRRLEREHKRTSAYLISAVDAVQEAFILLDEHDHVIMMNSAARELLGGSLGEAFVGRPFSRLLHDALEAGVFDDRHETRGALHQRWIAYHQQPAGVFEVRTGTGRHLRVTDRRTADHGTVLTLADVTDDVQRAEDLGQSRALAEAASAAKSEFLSSMSHELRTPLNAILGFAQLLRADVKQPLAERQLQRLEHVLRGGEHLLRLIDDVLDLSRIEAGRVSLSCEPVELGDVLAEVVHSIEPMATRVQIEIDAMPMPPGAPHVIADRTRLTQILMNFGSNAIKYGKSGGRVTVRPEVLDHVLRVSVIDDGIGIPEDKRDKIFEPFQRAGQETGPIQGTGIGLTISRRLAELMRATIGFTSAVGQGSAFWIDLPIHRERATDGAVAQRTVHGPSRLAAGDRRHVIVYVEDNPSNIAFMRGLVDDLASVELLIASSAEIGLELIRAHQPSVVIMDINLPGMDGFEATRRLRDWPETRDIPVIGLSAAALARDTARAKEAGFYRYLTKPVKVDELTDTLEQLLEGV